LQSCEYDFAATGESSMITKDFSIPSVYERTVVPKYMYDIILYKQDKLVNVLDK
jgi:hypothetical protein